MGGVTDERPREMIVKTRNKRIAVLAGVGVLVGGGLAGAFAATSGQDDPAGDLASALSKRTGEQITPAEVKGAFTDVLKQRLQEQVAAGRITQDQADTMLERAKDAPLPGMHGPGDRGHHGRGGHGMDAIEAAVGKKIGLTEEQIDEQEAQGKTLAQIAEAKGMSRDDLISTISATIKASERGQGITDAQATQVAKDIADGKKGPKGGHRGGPGREAVEQAITKSLGITEDAWHQAREAGKTAADVAKEKGVDVATVVDAVQAALKAQGQKAGAPKLDDAQVTAMATAIVNGRGPGGHGPGEHGPGGPHGGWGP